MNILSYIVFGVNLALAKFESGEGVKLFVKNRIIEQEATTCSLAVIDYVTICFRQRVYRGFYQNWHAHSSLYIYFRRQSHGVPEPPYRHWIYHDEGKKTSPTGSGMAYTRRTTSSKEDKPYITEMGNLHLLLDLSRLEREKSNSRSTNNEIISARISIEFKSSSTERQ